MAKKLILETTETGCVVPTSHKLNKDGYFRKDIGNRTYVMYHRYAWEQANYVIPVGFEIDHLCKNRACCNIEHLQCINGTQHAVESNETRYKDRKDAAETHWRNTLCKGVELSREFDVTTSAACRWIRSWKV